jgi:hypothetical protein
MVLRKLMGLFVCALIISVASASMAGIPDLDESSATIATTGQVLSLFNLPNGGGNPLTACQLADGTSVDGTITVTLLDANTDVIAGFPAEDLWLESVDGGMVPCVGGSTADGDTDENGVTDFQNALNAGGWSLANATVVVSGDAITSAVFGLHFNSADMNGDGVVNLADVGSFSTIFYGAYDFSADFFADGVLNLADVGLLATGVGAACP